MSAADDTPAWAYDEDGYCVCCGNGRWKYHAAPCQLRDALDALEPHVLTDLPDPPRWWPYAAFICPPTEHDVRDGQCTACGMRVPRDLHAGLSWNTGSCNHEWPCPESTTPHICQYGRGGHWMHRCPCGSRSDSP